MYVVTMALPADDTNSLVSMNPMWTSGELFDLETDPHELTSVYASPAYS